MEALLVFSPLRPAPRDLPAALPKIELQRGQALWVLSQLGFKGGSSDATFREYIKSLRKLGIPFDRGSSAELKPSQANYKYVHLMELALVLSLRVYHAVPDVLLRAIIDHRKLLYRHYRSAFADRNSGLGRNVTFEHSNGKSINAGGIYIDLKLNFSGAKLISFGPPTLLSPAEAVTAFVQRDVAARPLLPINLSWLAEDVVKLSLSAPSIRRGPAPQSVRRA